MILLQISSNSPRKASAAGQEEQPWEVYSSTTTIGSPALARVDGAAASPIARAAAVMREMKSPRIVIDFSATKYITRLAVHDTKPITIR